MINLYESSGYLDIRSIFNSNYPFVFEIGGRGIGKTYGSIKFALENHIEFGLMRRTAVELDMITSPAISPVVAIGRDVGMPDIIGKSSKQYTTFRYDDQIIGYGFALSTVATLRGFSASTMEWLIFDEFITEPHVRKMKQEGLAFVNAVETIGRNRELQGLPPLKAHLLANTFNLDNPILEYFGLVDDIAEAQEDGREIIEYQDRGILVVLPQKSRISEAKRGTALYRAVDNRDFENLALNNIFKRPAAVVKSADLKQYKPLFEVEGLYIWRHKSQPVYHICTIRAGTPERVKVKQIFTRAPGLLLALTHDRVSFDNLSTFYKFAEITGLDT